MKKMLLVSLLAIFAVAAFSQAPAKISPAAAKALLAKDATVLLIDVRTAEEFASGHIKGAKLLPFDSIDATSAKMIAPDKNQTIVLYCHSGRRSGIAAASLGKLGYTKLLDLGGLLQWPYGLVSGKQE